MPTTTPRFSWQLSLPPPRNLTQAAYHLRVGTTAALVGGAGAERADTGGVASASSWLVAPPCAALAAGGSYWWSVQVTTSDGSVSPFSAPQRFAVGLQGRTDWSASAAFIGYANGADQSSTPWFRNRFELSAPELAAVRAGTSAALLHVASAGFHEAYVNGVRLEPESMLIPSNSNLNVRVLAHTYDVADALNAGTNTLGLWASPGWASLSVGCFSPSLSKYPLVMAELRVVPHDKQAGVAFAPSLVVVTRPTPPTLRGLLPGSVRRPTPCTSATGSGATTAASQWITAWINRAGRRTKAGAADRGAP